jgi:hypothetical protein
MSFANSTIMSSIIYERMYASIIEEVRSMITDRGLMTDKLSEHFDNFQIPLTNTEIKKRSIKKRVDTGVPTKKVVLQKNLNKEDDSDQESLDFDDEFVF